MTKTIQAVSVKIDDEMDVLLSLSFETSDGSLISLARPYRFDSDHECMGLPHITHHHRRWPSAEHYDWGRWGELELMDLGRQHLLLKFDDRAAGHPKGITAFDIRFDLPELEFAKLLLAVSRGFKAFDWYVQSAA